MVKLLAVITLNLAELMCLIRTALIHIFFLFLAKFYLDSVNPNSYRGARLLSLFSTLVADFLLLIFAGFFGSFKLVLKSLKFLNRGFLIPSFSFLGHEIIYSSALSMKFDSYRRSAFGKLLIGQIRVMVRNKSGFCLSIKLF